MADQKYTQEQFSNFVDNLFATHDTNADGQLDKNESRTALQAAHEKFGQGKPWNEERFEAVFAAVDANGDGLIDKSELFNSLHKVATERGLLEWNRVFISYYT